jgi:hypothetical protein
MRGTRLAKTTDSAAHFSDQLERGQSGVHQVLDCASPLSSLPEIALQNLSHPLLLSPLGAHTEKALAKRGVEASDPRIPTGRCNASPLLGERARVGKRGSRSATRYRVCLRSTALKVLPDANSNNRRLAQKVSGKDESPLAPSERMTRTTTESPLNCHGTTLHLTAP